MTNDDWKAMEQAHKDAVHHELMTEMWEEQYCKDNGITDIRQWRMENLMNALDLYEPLQFQHLIGKSSLSF